VENEEKNLGLGNERSCTYGDTSSVQYGVSMAMGAILRYIYSTAAANWRYTMSKMKWVNKALRKEGNTNHSRF
jgi:hypothetical protein